MQTYQLYTLAVSKPMGNQVGEFDIYGVALLLFCFLLINGNNFLEILDFLCGAVFLGQKLARASDWLPKTSCVADHATDHG